MLVDFHVHCYGFYDLNLLLRSVERHVSRAFGVESGDDVLLCLTERSGEFLFDSWSQSGWVDAARSMACQIADDGLSVSMPLGAPGGRRVHWLSGRQLVTAERIEVLALALRGTLAEGLPLADTVEAVNAAGAVAVLPWSPGKWSFERGRLIQKVLAAGGTFALGSTAMHRWMWRDHALLEAYRTRYPVLPGSDPLPLKGEESQVGRILSRVPISGALPGSELREWFALGAKDLCGPALPASFVDSVLRSVRLRMA
jgi:hypothetical protein